MLSVGAGIPLRGQQVAVAVACRGNHALIPLGIVARACAFGRRRLVLGGSLSLWSDNYCSGTVECGGWAYCPGSKWPAGAPFPSEGGNTTACVSGIGWMQDEKNDAAFIQSAGGLLFPRSNVGAGAFW